MSWGTELWDRYDSMCTYTSNGIDFLDTSVAQFIKERGKVENEYASKLRTLVKRFSPKDMPSANATPVGARRMDGKQPTRSDSRASTLKRGKNKSKASEAGLSGPTSLGTTSKRPDEYGHTYAFKQMLTEVGYIAGQHELLAESFQKDNYRNVHDHAKKLKEIRKRNMEEHQTHLTELKQVYKAMERAKEKFRKAFEEQEKAIASHKSADGRGDITVNDIKKLQMQMQAKISICDSMKGQYANQMLKTNEARNRFYGQLLPNVLNELQQMEQTRVALLTECIREMINKEREVAPIITRCHDAIEVAINDVVPEADTEMVVEKNKTGDVPPGDFNFGDMNDPQSLLAQDALEATRPTNRNLYPKKRELDAQILATTEDLTRKRRELEGLQKMVQTCTIDPKKSDAFKKEVNGVAGHVKELEGLLQSLTSERAEVERQLEDLQKRNSPRVGRFEPDTGSMIESPLLNTMNRSIKDRSRGSNQSVRSNRSSTNFDQSSIASSSGNSAGSNYCPSGISSAGNIPPPPPMPSFNPPQYDVPEAGCNNGYNKDAYDPPELQPPPPYKTIVAPTNSGSAGFASPTGSSNPPFSSTSSESSENDKRCEAVYDYAECDPNNIAMRAGEHFVIVEEEVDGWTRVRRHIGAGYDEGYVPSSYLRVL